MFSDSIKSNIDNISGIKELWAETLGDPNICIAILDGPVDQTHHSLTAANLKSINTLGSGAVGQGSASQHGTHIASVIFGQHDGPVKGIAPQCRGLILPVFRDGVDDSIAPCSQIDLARAISQAVQEGAHIINISGGELTPTGTAHPLLADTVRDCADRGVLIVAAAGNQGCDCLHIPGALPSVLAVGAMDSQGMPLDFSNWGEKYQSQGILAPGKNILGATPSGGTVANSGTSYATPVVSGIVALLLSIQLKYGQESNPHGIRAAILNSAIGCEDLPLPDCRRLLAGRININEALIKDIKGGINMSDSSEIQKIEHSQNLENINGKPITLLTPQQDLQVTASDNNGLEKSNNSPHSPTDSPLETQNDATQIKKNVIASSQVDASECGCSDSARTQLVFTNGPLGYDFGTEARRVSIMQHMESPAVNIQPNPHDPAQLLAYLEGNPWEADSIIWTLNFDATPVYAIKPKDAFSMETYQRLRQFLREQTDGEIERISLGGIIYGSIRLLTGQVVPVICPNLRCMYSWNTVALINAASGTSSGSSEKTKKSKADKDNGDDTRNFLERVYHELRNLGIDPCHRAINYSATNALNVQNIFASALNDSMELDTIECERSPICRPDSDCWDVKLIFFDPENQLKTRKVYRFTVDVSDVCPVMVGSVRSWFVR